MAFPRARRYRWAGMRPIVLLFALPLAALACSQEVLPTPPTGALIVVNGPSAVATRVCQPCGNGDLEVAADIVVQETAGVGGQVTGLEVLLRSGSTVLAGPGQYNAADVTTFAGTDRISARGSLTIRNVAMHFSPAFRASLPATYSINVQVRDDRGNTSSTVIGIQATP